MAITAYGRALLRRGIRAFHELRQSIKDIELLSEPMAGDVQIGCPEAIACGLLLAILDRFSFQHPRVVLSVSAHNMPLQFRMLRDRNVDFLIGGLPNPLRTMIWMWRSFTGIGRSLCPEQRTGGQVVARSNLPSWLMSHGYWRTRAFSVRSSRKLFNRSVWPARSSG